MMKFSWVFLVLSALVICGARFAESNEVPIPIGAVKVHVVEEPSVQTIAEEPQVFQEKLKVLPGPSADSQPLLKPASDELEAEKDVAIPQVLAEKRPVQPAPLAMDIHVTNEAEKKDSSLNENNAAPKAGSKKSAVKKQLEKIQKVVSQSTMVEDKKNDAKKVIVSEAMAVQDSTVEKNTDKLEEASVSVPPSEDKEQSSVDMKMENSSVDESVRKPASEIVVALPPVLEMIMDKSSKPEDSAVFMQQPEAEVASDMRLPRQVQTEDEQKPEDSLNNVEAIILQPNGLSGERAVQRRQGVRRTSSKKGVSLKRRKVNSNNRRRINRRKPNAVRRKNNRRGQVNGMIKGQNLKNGQWVRKGQWIRKKTNNNRVVRWYNIKTGQVVRNVRHGVRVKGNKNGIKAHRKPAKKHQKNRNAQQKPHRAQFNKNQLPNQKN